MFSLNLCIPQVLQQLHPLGLRDDWADKLAAQEFVARNALTTFEHYLQASAPILQSYELSNRAL